MMKILIFILAVVMVLLFVLELGLRLAFGFGNPLLYQADQEIGYLLLPNQQVRRMGNRIIINQYSMRSHPITATRPPHTLRILLLGDSIANGGWWTDQEETIASLIKNQVKLAQFSQIEVLNASANSWGPRNQLAYLRRFGTFEAQTVILLLNTDDLFATAPTSIPVGRDRNCSNRKPPLALVEVFTQIILPPRLIPEMAAVIAEKGDRVGFNLAAIKSIQDLVKNDQGELILALTPLTRELDPATQRDYELKARQRLQQFTKQEAIPYIDFLGLFQQETQPLSLYRDNIHLSSIGNQKVSYTLSEFVQRNLVFSSN
jgi:hypothetical protein